MMRTERERREARQASIDEAAAEGFDVSVTEVADRCGVNKSTVWRWIKRGLLSCRRIGTGGGSSPGIYLNWAEVVELVEWPEDDGAS